MADVRPGTAGTRHSARPEPAPAASQVVPAKPGGPDGPVAEPSLGDLVASASKDLSTLVRSEIELAKLELTAEAKKAVMGGAMFGVAGVLGLFALIMASFAAAYGIASLGLAYGWSFLIVAGAYLFVALVAVLIGARSVKKVGPPKRTIKTAKETVAVLKKAGRPTS
jgi:hypothetical protein